MAKTGNAERHGTAESAILGRALHTLHAARPVLDDPWAHALLDEATREVVRSPAMMASPLGAAMAPILAVNIGCARHAEECVEAAVARGVRQYLVLGAGFDTFALRRADLAQRGLRVFEVDHPDVQRLKRARVKAAAREPAAFPEFVPVDFEVTELGPELARSRFDRAQPAVVSWLNTLPYLTAEATRGTLEALRDACAPGSVLVANYQPDTPPSAEQAARMEELERLTQSLGEPLRTHWAPADFSALLDACGFTLVSDWNERELHAAYFAERTDGFSPGMPIRVVTAERR